MEGGGGRRGWGEKLVVLQNTASPVSYRSPILTVAEYIQCACIMKLKI